MIRVRINTKQFFSNLPPYSVIHDVVLQAKSRSAGQTCTFRAFRGLEVSQSAVYAVVSDMIKSAVSAIEFTIDMITLDNGRAIATRVDQDGVYIWKTSTNVFMVLLTPECAQETDFEDPTIVELQHSFHTPTTSAYSQYNGADSTNIVAISQVLNSISIKTKLYSATPISQTELDLVDQTPNLHLDTTMSTRAFTNIAVGPTSFNLLDFDSRVENSLQTIDFEMFSAFAITRSFVHGFSIHSCTEGVDDLDSLSQFKYNISQNISLNYANKELGPNGQEWLTYDQFDKHPSVYSVSPQLECLQPYKINDVHGQSGGSSSFLVATTEVQLFSPGELLAFKPFTNLAYAVMYMREKGEHPSSTIFNTKRDNYYFSPRWWSM